MKGSLKPARLFQNGMVLQQGKPAVIWGQAEPGALVTVSILDQRHSCRCHNGSWQVTLDPLPVSWDAWMTISTETESIQLENVAVGEVWIAAGQSNMEFYLRYDAERACAKEDPDIRFFDCPKAAYPGQLDTYDATAFGFWRPCTGENLDWFSAVGYYFAARLRRDRQVPVGILGCTWGATPACAWMDPDMLKNTKGDIWNQDYQQQIQGQDETLYEQWFQNHQDPYLGKPFQNAGLEKMMYGLTREETAQMLAQFSAADFELPMEGPKSEKRPGGLYKNMVRTLAPYTVSGVLWYQGENDDRHPEVYADVLKALINCWRTLWQDQLPFLLVQLAPFSYWAPTGHHIFPMLRQAQEQVSRETEKVWMTSVMDCGLLWDIHPKRKRPAGERLALLAEGHVYGEDVLCDAPTPKELSVQEGLAVIRMHSAGEGLWVKGETLQALELYLNGEQKDGYTSRAEGDCLMIRHPDIHPEQRVEILYAQRDDSEVNLYSSAGLTAVPFRLCHP